jgi:hypothetical protein
MAQKNAIKPGNSMRLPMYNLFTEDHRGNPVWLDALADLESAHKRLLKLASVDPGDYFIFDFRTQQTVGLTWPASFVG